MYESLIEYMNSVEFQCHPPQTEVLEEADSPFRDKHLTVKLMDVEDVVKKNDVKEITNPVFFSNNNIPTSDGLLSNDIFGITREERANIWGYIDLQGVYLHPLVYRIWSKMDRSIANIAHGLKSYKVDSSGFIVEDPKGETGIEFLAKNISKIKIRETGAESRTKNIQFIMKNKDRLFIKKMLVQPPFYRDVLSGAGKVEVGQLNKYYSSLLISTRALKETQEMGFSLGDATKGRIQETVLDIYKCVTGTSSNPADGTGLSGKTGIIQESALSKTADYGTRLVITAPELKVESLEDIMSTTTHCALPLSSAIVNFKPFIVFAVRRLFENFYMGNTSVPVLMANGKVEYGVLKDPGAIWSDQNIENEINEFIHTFGNRFKPVMVDIEVDGKVKRLPLVFKGKNVSSEDYAKGNIEGAPAIADRNLTWCDVLYMAAVEATRDKCVMVTRFPYDSSYNSIPQMINISTIKNTEPMYVNGEFYRWYPRIRQRDVGSNTSNLFLDTLTMNNMVVENMGGDYDGDTVGVKGVWLQESNKECIDFLHSKSFYIDFSGGCIKQAHHENIQSLYSLTKVLSADEKRLTEPKF